MKISSTHSRQWEARPNGKGDRAIEVVVLARWLQVDPLEGLVSRTISASPFTRPSPPPAASLPDSLGDTSCLNSSERASGQPQCATTTGTKSNYSIFLFFVLVFLLPASSAVGVFLRCCLYALELIFAVFDKV